MKINRHHIASLLAAWALACSGPRLQAQIATLSTFDTGTQGGQSTQYVYPGTLGTGGVTLTHLYDDGSISWDGTHDDTGNGGGSAFLSANLNSGECCGKPLLEAICFNYDNPYYNGNGTIDFSTLSAIQFDVLWDPTSSITPDQFNTLTNWPLALLPSWNTDPNYLVDVGNNFTTGIELDFTTGAGDLNYLGKFFIPDSATNTWKTITVPITDSTPGLSGAVGVGFQKYISTLWPIQGNVRASFWVDNLVLISNVVPVPPPTLNPPTPAVSGLNIFASTEGSLYDRQSALFVPKTGLSWVGSTNTGAPTYPVSYSVTLQGFPKNISGFSSEAYLFLVPNAANQEQAPDYNETNCAVMEIQSTGTGGGQATFYYKANEAGAAGQNMYFNLAPNTNTPGSWPGAATVALTNWFEQGNLTNVKSATLLGTWTLQFSSAENGTLIAPDGTTSSFTIPSYYAANFMENGSTATPFNIYLGMQANTAAAINQPVTYGSFSLTNVGGNFSENFVAENTLNTTNWNPAYATGPAGVVVVPTNAPYWVGWSLPASGFNLTDSGTLAPGAKWKNVSTYAPISMYGVDMQLISSRDVTGTNAEFFQMTKQSFTQLLVLLPGQTLDPTSPTGVSGTPTPVSDGDNAGEMNITVYAVDQNFNPISGPTDSIAITSSTDGDAILPNNMSMNNGVAIFDSSNPFFFYDETGSETVTATDQTNPGITAATSSPVTVTP